MDLKLLTQENKEKFRKQCIKNVLELIGKENVARKEKGGLSAPLAFWVYAKNIDQWILGISESVEKIQRKIEILSDIEKSLYEKIKQNTSNAFYDPTVESLYEEAYLIETMIFLLSATKSSRFLLDCQDAFASLQLKNISYNIYKDRRFLKDQERKNQQIIFNQIFEEQNKKEKEMNLHEVCFKLENQIIQNIQQLVQKELEQNLQESKRKEEKQRKENSFIQEAVLQNIQQSLNKQKREEENKQKYFDLLLKLAQEDESHYVRQDALKDLKKLMNL